MTKDRPPRSSIHHVIAYLASGRPLLFALPWLMFLLIAGTVAQKEMGLYAAQHIFFSAWILWLGPLPLPGTYATLSFISLALLIKFMAYSPWKKSQAGIIITHLGILLLMIGGLLTAATQKEGFVALHEGQSANTISDYHKRVLKIQKNDQDFLTIPFAEISEGQVLPVPFDARIVLKCNNCRPEMTKNPEGRKGLAAKIQLTPAPQEKENEANLSGVTMEVGKAGEDSNGLYVMVEEIPHKPEIVVGDDSYSFSLGRAETIMPFDIELESFVRDMHPGTNMARGFSSSVIVKDNAIEWPAIIRMNEPLRYKGYTFYQSSFSIRPDGEVSILSVVHNKGRVFPYLASLIIFAGLALHILIRFRTDKRAA